MPWRGALQQSDGMSWWEAVRTGVEVGGPWGVLGGLGLAVWRYIISPANESAQTLRQRTYADAVERMEKERAEYDADRARWMSDHETLMREIRRLQGINGDGREPDSQHE